jgi:hypothetical protein
MLKNHLILSLKTIFCSTRCQHIVEKYSVTSVQITTDDIDN